MTNRRMTNRRMTNRRVTSRARNNPSITSTLTLLVLATVAVAGVIAYRTVKSWSSNILS